MSCNLLITIVKRDGQDDLMVGSGRVVHFNPFLYCTVHLQASLGLLAQFAAHCPQHLRLHGDPPTHEAIVR
jgi:hypothetical protein